jgi:hypothetical protein
VSYKTAHRVLVFGGRDFINYDLVDQALTSLENSVGPFAVIQGGARGADACAKLWATKRGAPCVEVSAPWDFYGKRAGHMRNAWMLEVCYPTYAVAFPGGTGTADMARRCRVAGVTLWEISA